MHLDLITDGQKWALKRYKSRWFTCDTEYFAFAPVTSQSQWFPNCLSEFCWTDKATAELWYRRLTA